MEGSAWTTSSPWGTCAGWGRRAWRSSPGRSSFPRRRRGGSFPAWKGWGFCARREGGTTWPGGTFWRSGPSPSWRRPGAARRWSGSSGFPAKGPWSFSAASSGRAGWRGWAGGGHPLPEAVMLHLVLYQPEIPQNAGNVARTAAALGWPLHLIRPLGFLLSSPKLKRAGLDYWPHVDLRLHDSFAAFLEALPRGRGSSPSAPGGSLPLRGPLPGGGLPPLRPRKPGASRGGPRPLPHPKDPHAGAGALLEPGGGRGGGGLRGLPPAHRAMRA